MEDDELLNRGTLLVVGDSLENPLVHTGTVNSAKYLPSPTTIFFAIGCWVEYLHQGLQPI